MTWMQPRVTGVTPQARNAQTVTVVGSRLFLFGGHSGNKHLRVRCGVAPRICSSPHASARRLSFSLSLSSR